jgi:hypothetical protein
MKTQLRTRLPDTARTALDPLWKSFACAQDLKVDPWDFALRLTHLIDLGVAPSDLRWLVLRGYVTFCDRARRFPAGTNVAASDDPRVMITAAGVSIASPIAVTTGASPDRCSNSGEILPLGSRLPWWDGRLRQLSFEGIVVKQFRLPANNQAAVLSAFQDENWPPSIDDPLPYMSRTRSKERLHATIRCLNSHHENRLIRFRGNGTGEAVLWEPVADLAVDRSTSRSGLGRAA